MSPGLGRAAVAWPAGPNPGDDKCPATRCIVGAIADPRTVDAVAALDVLAVQPVTSQRRRSRSFDAQTAVVVAAR